MEWKRAPPVQLCLHEQLKELSEAFRTIGSLEKAKVNRGDILTPLPAALERRSANSIFGLMETPGCCCSQSIKTADLCSKLSSAMVQLVWFD
jgi:hypothetical protein